MAEDVRLSTICSPSDDVVAREIETEVLGVVGQVPPAASPSLSRRSLAVASLDIGRVLADRDGVTFRAQGSCMYPTVRAGDVLRIRSCAAADVTVGDIAVCRTPTYLFSHRVIGVGERDGRRYIVTRPDRSLGGSDAPTFDDDLLGVVVGIERSGISAPLQPTSHAWVVRRYLGARLVLVEAEPRLRVWLIGGLAVVQERKWYGRVARQCFDLYRPRLSFAVRIPLNATLGDAVYRQVEAVDFDPEDTWSGRPRDRWTLTLQVNGAGGPAAWAAFARGPQRSWRLAESYVRMRYRGLGLEEALLWQAAAIVARSGGHIDGAEGRT